jgi:hypothetical protein
MPFSSVEGAGVRAYWCLCNIYLEIVVDTNAIRAILYPNMSYKILLLTNTSSKYFPNR